MGGAPGARGAGTNKGDIYLYIHIQVQTHIHTRIPRRIRIGRHILYTFAYTHLHIRICTIHYTSTLPIILYKIYSIQSAFYIMYDSKTLYIHICT